MRNMFLYCNKIQIYGDKCNLFGKNLTRSAFVLSLISILLQQELQISNKMDTGEYRFIFKADSLEKECR